MKSYFSKHYALMNNIDLNSEDSINKWYNEASNYYDNFLIQHIKSYDNKSILELGCGIGGLLNFLKIKGINNYLGVDHSEEQLSVCKKYVTTKVVNDDVLSFLRKNESKYDIIFLFDLIEHIKKDRIIEFVGLLHNTLNLDGQILLRTPNMGSLFGLWNRYCDFTHELGFTEESIRQVFNQFEFSDIKVFNSYVGRKRLIAVKFYQWILEKFYNIKLSNIITQDLFLVASKNLQ